jgi:hypothetical protein
MVSLKLETYIFTVAKTKLKLARLTRKALRIISTLRMCIDVAVLVENTRRIFGRAREGNLGSRWIFLTVLAGHKKKLLAGRYLPTPALGNSHAAKWTAVRNYLQIVPKLYVQIGSVWHVVTLWLFQEGMCGGSGGVEPSAAGYTTATECPVVTDTVQNYTLTDIANRQILFCL